MSPSVARARPLLMVTIALWLVTPAQAAETLLDDHFDAEAGAFSFEVDAFRGTSQPAYASGDWAADAGVAGGGLGVELGGRDKTPIDGMSAGWRASFALAAPAAVQLSLRFELVQAKHSDRGELSQALASIDGQLLSGAGSGTLAELDGDGNGGSDQSTGWVAFVADLGTLAAGSHELVIGAWASHKDHPQETTRLRIDDVLVTTLDVCAAAVDCDDADPCTADSCDPLLGCSHVPIDGCGQIGGTSGTPSTPTVPALPLGGRAVLAAFLLMAGRAAARRGRRSA